MLIVHRSQPNFCSVASFGWHTTFQRPKRVLGVDSCPWVLGVFARPRGNGSFQTRRSPVGRQTRAAVGRGPRRQVAGADLVEAARGLVAMGREEKRVRVAGGGWRTAGSATLERAPSWSSRREGTVRYSWLSKPIAAGSDVERCVKMSSSRRRGSRRRLLTAPFQADVVPCRVSLKIGEGGKGGEGWMSRAAGGGKRWEIGERGRGGKKRLSRRKKKLEMGPNHLVKGYPVCPRSLPC